MLFLSFIHHYTDMKIQRTVSSSYEYLAITLEIIINLHSSATILFSRAIITVGKVHLLY